jgi:hypothetical protein
MNKKSRHYFVTGNTAQGFVNKLSSNLQGIKTLFIIRGRPGTGKARIMPFIAGECERADLPAEFLHCPSAPESYDGIVIPQLRLAVVDGTDLHYTALITPVPDVQYIDATSDPDDELLSLSDDRLADILQKIGSCHEKAFKHFSDALCVHDEWEKIYISNMDFKKADLLTAYVTELLLGSRRMNKTPVSKERFFGAGTPAGAMDYIENLTADTSSRYLLKGRPGTGKSTLLRKLAAASGDRGLDTEVYSCAFDSNSLDMILWPELDLCLFDSTAPHLYEPSRPNDKVIDMYAECVTPGTDEKYETALEDITTRYKASIGRGTAALAEAKISLDALTALYSAASNIDAAQKLCGNFTRLLRG